MVCHIEAQGRKLTRGCPSLKDCFKISLILDDYDWISLVPQSCACGYHGTRAAGGRCHSLLTCQMGICVTYYIRRCAFPAGFFLHFTRVTRTSRNGKDPSALAIHG